MPYDLDFPEIAKTPILDVAAMLGFDLKEIQAKVKEETVTQYVGQCPISKSGNATVFKITPSINRFVCFCLGCAQYTDKKGKPKRGGDCIELVRRMKGIDYRAAALEIQKHFGADKVAENAQPQQEVETSRNSADFDPLKYLASLNAEHEALKDLDILPDTLVAFKAGYASNGRQRGRLSVAWHDMTGEIKGFIGVALNGELPRYLSFKKELPLPYWFGCHRIEAGELRILPTVLDVLSASENGETNVICPLAPTNADALTSLRALLLEKNCTLEF